MTKLGRTQSYSYYRILWTIIKYVEMHISSK
jgi:hypothetical protein